MKRQWRSHRQLRTATDGAQRGDQAYQLLLQLAAEQPEVRVSPPTNRGEATDARSDLRPGVDHAASAAADD